MTEIRPCDDLIIRINDVRACGHCPLGIRRWFEDHGFDFRDFKDNGIPASRLLATGDGLAVQVVKIRRARLDAQ